MKHLKLIAISLSLLAVSIFAVSGVASAQSVKAGETVTVVKGETVDSLLFAGGNNIDIAGTVNGDVYCAGQNITISGIINGDIFCAGQNINVSGTVTGDVRLAGQTVTLGGIVDGSATVAAQTFLLQENSTIGRDLLGGVQAATLNGGVSRDVALSAASLAINGQIGRNVKGDIESLSVGSAGRVGGDVTYNSNNTPTISADGEITGKVVRTPFSESESGNVNVPFETVLMSALYGFIALLFLALAVVLLFPSVVHDATFRALKSPGRTTLVGLVSIVVMPILIVVLLVSAIGIPLGILVLLSWLVVSILSGPFVGYLLGRLMLKSSKNTFLIMLLGMSVLLVLCFIPVVGFIVMFAAYLFGTGIVLNEAMRRIPKPVQKAF